MRKLKLKSLITRDTSFRPAAKEDMKYLWAAYKKEAFNEETFPKGMDLEHFKAAIGMVFGTLDETYVLEAVTKHGKIPVGLVGTFVSARTEPHVEWFPWASARNKLESVAHFFKKMQNRPMLVWSSDEDAPFYTHVSRYGVLRRIGKVHNFIGGKDYMLFQTRGV